MSKVPVNVSALHEMRTLVSEAHELLREAREQGDPGKLAEVENRLNRLHAAVCPIIIMF